MSDADLERLRALSGVERTLEFERLLESYRPRLRRMVGLRLDPRVRARVDESDVLQDAFVEVTRRLEEYLAKPDMPFFLWIRFVATQRVIQLHRRHLGAEARRVDRELRLAPGGWLEATSRAIAARLVWSGPSPSDVAARAEQRARVEEALESMDATDREVLALRHFEQLTNGEVARLLGLSVGTASKRYLRALDRLRDILGVDSGDGACEGAAT